MSKGREKTDMVEHIVFDLGQVLVKVAFLDFAKKFARAFEIDPKVILEADDSGPHKYFMTGEISGEEFHRRLCQAFGKDMPLTDFKELWLEMLDGQIDQTVEIVAQLAEKGYPLSILSNIDAWHYEYCEKTFPVMKYFSKKFLSFQLKLKKPDPKIFEIVAAELGAEPGACLLIDDNLENVESAKQVGFEIIRFTGAEDLRKDLIRMHVLKS